jgi:hypothetical protein
MDARESREHLAPSAHSRQVVLLSAWPVWPHVVCRRLGCTRGAPSSLHAGHRPNHLQSAGRGLCACDLLGAVAPRDQRSTPYPPRTPKPITVLDTNRPPAGSARLRRHGHRPCAQHGPGTRRQNATVMCCGVQCSRACGNASWRCCGRQPELYCPVQPSWPPRRPPVTARHLPVTEGGVTRHGGTRLTSRTVRYVADATG